MPITRSAVMHPLRVLRGGQGRGRLVEVRIGIQNSGRELAFESAESPAAVQKTIGDAIEKKATHFSLSDENGRLYLVPTASLAYVEVGSEKTRRVGFVA